MARRVQKLLPIVWLMVLLLLPLTLYMLGVRQPLLENRGRTEFPEIARSTIQADATYRQIDDAIRERLPLRGEAIEIRAHIATDVFGDSSNPEVILGSDEWLYYRPELLICDPNGVPKVPPEDVIEILTRTITASGRRPVVVVAGSKIVTHQENLEGVEVSDLDCLREAESKVQSRLVKVSGAYSIQPKLDRLEASGRATFLRSDTHWNYLGRLVFLNTLLEGVRPGLASRVRLRALGKVEHSGDIGPLLGEELVEQDRLVTVTGGVGNEFDPGEVLISGDSQLWNSIDAPGIDGKSVIDHVFPDQPECDQYEFQEHGCAGQMVDAETIVFESVSRNFQLLEAMCRRPVAALASTVRGLPARWVDGDPFQRPVGSTPARIRLENDRSGIPRLLVIPLRKLPERGETVSVIAIAPSETDRPCAQTTVPDGNIDTIVIPIAAGERVDRLELDISGPPGVELGRPEVLPLDGRPLPSRD
jgi:hypothetical protein